MNFPITRTKITIPHRRPDLLTRPRLLDLLYELLEDKLIIVAAPAGYGKTSLLIDFASQADLPVCWYSLDTLDRDPQRFFAHFIAALAQRFPAFGRQSSTILDAGGQAPLDIDRFVATLVNEVDDAIHEHFLYVLDDFHLVNENKEIEGFLSRFVYEVGENCHVIISSRTLLALPGLPLLVARSQVGGLSFDELAFQSSEIRALVAQRYQVVMPETAAEELARETEGWITGLLLSAQTMWQGMVDRLRVARVSGVGLYDYLAQQVLDGQPPAVREFLLRTSLLEEFDAELCAAVFGPDQAWPELIELLLQNNLFVLPVGEDGRWIRYHHLFRDFLQARFGAELAGEKEPLLFRLVEVYAERGEWDRAYAACLKLGEVDSLADLIERAGSALVKSGRLRTTADWIDALPAAVLSERPGLLSMRGVAAIAQGQVEQGLSLINTAEQAQRATGDRQGLAYTLVRRATTHRFLGNYAASLRDAQEALVLVSEAESLHPVQAEAWRASGMSLYQLGRLNEAIGHLEQSLNAYQALHDRQNVALVLMELGLASMTAGRYRLAQENYLQALQFWHRSGNLAGQANLLNNLAVLHHLMGHYEQAITSFEEALEYATQSAYTRFEAYILSGIGDLYSDLDAGEAARDAYQRSRQLAVQMDDRFLLLYIDLAEARLARKAGFLAAAEQLLFTSAESLGSRDSSYEQALWQLEQGRLLRAQDRLMEAIAALTAACGAFEAGGQLVEAARSALHLGLVQFQALGLREALPTLEQAFQLSARLESPHVLVVAGREAEALLQAASEQGPGNVQAAVLLERVRAFARQIPALRRRLRPRTAAVPFAPPKLVIQGLGRGSVELDGHPVIAAEWQNQKRVREFFFCLLAHPDGLTKEEIGLLFWPDSSPAQLKLQFKNTIYRLRCALGPDIVLFDEDRYWFNRELDYEYDVESFAAHLARARAAGSPGERTAAYRAAVDFYRGSLLPEMPGVWVWPERERLRQEFEEACLSLAELRLAEGNPQESIVLCQKVLAEEPCQEEAHRLAMRAYAALGNRAAVTRQFERCRRALWEEIHALPSQRTEATYHEALR